METLLQAETLKANIMVPDKSARRQTHYVGFVMVGLICLLLCEILAVYFPFVTVTSK
jgi:hypothetical protein